MSVPGNQTASLLKRYFGLSDTGSAVYAPAVMGISAGSMGTNRKRKISLVAALSGGAEIVRIRCACGHRVEMPVGPLIASMNPGATFNDVESRARCTACGNIGLSEAIPIYT